MKERRKKRREKEKKEEDKRKRKKKEKKKKKKKKGREEERKSRVRKKEIPTVSLTFLGDDTRAPDVSYFSSGPGLGPIRIQGSRGGRLSPFGRKKNVRVEVVDGFLFLFLFLAGNKGCGRPLLWDPWALVV